VQSIAAGLQEYPTVSGTIISIAAAKAACSFFGPFGLAICPVIVGLAFSYDTMQRHITHTGRIKNNKLIHI
jgi:hypothetical protein